MSARREDFSEELPYRVAFEFFPLSRRRRLRLWWRGVLDAIREVPPGRASRQVKVWPGDPRFDKAIGLVRHVHFLDGTYELKTEEKK